MKLANTMQLFQDWFTQEWVILFGRKINNADNAWLIGPFGEVNGIGEKFIQQLAKKENLTINRNVSSTGLLHSIKTLNYSVYAFEKLSQNIIDFYEKTSDFKMEFRVKWNLLFKPFGCIVQRFFSKRIQQLNIPFRDILSYENISSEIIELVSKDDLKVRYTIWLRKFQSTGQVIYSH
jgi:hypothetical protein